MINNVVAKVVIHALARMAHTVVPRPKGLNPTNVNTAREAVKILFAFLVSVLRLLCICCFCCKDTVINLR